MKVKGYGEVLLADKINMKKATGALLDFLTGVFSCALRVFGGRPIAFALTAVGSFPSFLGCIFAAIIGGEDFLRIAAALVAVFVSSRYIMPKFTFPGYVKVFISSLWGVLLAEVFGALIYNYTFYENLLFALSGLIGAVSATAMEYAKNAKERRKGDPNVFFISTVFSVSAVLCGMGFCGRLLFDTAAVIMIFTVLCLSVKTNLFYTVSFSVIIGGLSCLLNGRSVYFLALLVIGGILSSLLRDFSRFFVPFGFLSACLSFLIYTGFGSDAVTLCVYTLLSSLVFILVNDKVKTAFLTRFIPSLPMFSGKKYRIKKTDGAVSGNNPEKLCDNCPKKLICWSENYAFTKDCFMKIRSGNTRNVPSEFLSGCVRRKELKEICNIKTDGEGLLNIELSKVSSAKMGEKLCGDSVGNFRTADDREFVYIVDGMGTGNEASAQSRRGSGIIKKLTDNGLSEKDCLRALNDFLSRNGEEIIMGVDLCCIDRRNGIAEFYKAGAAPTYIIRKGNSYEIGTASVPIGVLDEINIEYNKCKLMPGDIIVMISDGFLSLGPAVFEEYLCGLKVEKDDSAVDITGKIMYAAETLGLLYKDDISVVAAKIS